MYVCRILCVSPLRLALDDEKIMPQGTLKWENEYMDDVVKLFLKDSNTNFDSLIKNIENDAELYEFVKNIILEGEEIIYVNTDEIVNLGTIYGILKNSNGICKINNRIYEQLIYNHMTIKTIRKNVPKVMSEYNYRLNFIKLDESVF